jgi:threonine dehydratase
MGAFKFRGAYNALARLSAEERARGVLAFSSGNHAQAVALASSLFGARATIVMPTNAPAAKRRATEGYGARVVDYDAATGDREAIARKIQAETGAALIPPFDHPDVIAGQGTAARELFQDVPDLDLLLVPCGGGGLLSGSALAGRRWRPRCRVIGVEPEAGDDANRSFRTGVLQTVRNPDTIADGARTASLGTLTFPLVRALAADMAVASDAEIVEAMRFAWERMKLVVEPTGVLGLAALLAGRLKADGQRVGIVLSGGNVDLPAAAALFAGA